MSENTVINTDRGEVGAVRVFTGGEASIELFPNGDIHVNGRKAANDQEVVDGLRSFLVHLQKEEADKKAETQCENEDWDKKLGKFEKDLEQLINSHSIETFVNEPDVAITKFLMDCLSSYKKFNRLIKYKVTFMEWGGAREIEASCPEHAAEKAVEQFEANEGGYDMRNGYVVTVEGEGRYAVTSSAQMNHYYQAKPIDPEWEGATK